MSAKFQNKGERDLFEHFHEADAKVRKKTKILLPDIKKDLRLSYENVIFIVIAFVMSCIICFSLGVEKGRKDIRNVSDRRQEIKDPGQGIMDQGPQKEVAGKYIIQLAAFKKISTAEKARTILKDKGYAGDIKHRGDYYQLYIKGFDSERNAEVVRKKLKEHYPDCYITQY